MHTIIKLTTEDKDVASAAAEIVILAREKGEDGRQERDDENR